MRQCVVVTGGAGFIGSELVRQLIAAGQRVVNVDKLGYAASLESLDELAGDERHTFIEADVCDGGAMAALLEEYRPGAVLHLAAESHVDRSIDGAAEFVHSNIVGTHTLLERCTRFYRGLDARERDHFRFIQVSTDEVFGPLGKKGSFREDRRYDPRSPYAATKASADHLVSAWNHTHGLPTIISCTSNNYGPWQYPEKLIPLMIGKAIDGEPLPVYGSGENVRDWIHVRDHVRALRLLLDRGRPGERYNIGSGAQMTNIGVVRRLCAILDELAPDSPHVPHDQLIENVADRPGHDFRYAMDSSTIERELECAPQVAFDAGLRETVAWYLEHRDWWLRVRQRGYAGERLGLREV
jgi:dTDP-glucose 4,6-dehydratase